MTRVNIKLRVKLASVVLTPYRKQHVERYWQWMQDKELQRLTGSEPLTLEEEHQNQVSWRDDPNKCTFIITDTANKMVGDVNLFLRTEDGGQVEGELNVMIAEPALRRKGLGTQAVAGMMWFAQKHLKVTRFVAKIALDNIVSKAMFESKFGFKETARSEAFQEVTLHSGEDLRERLAAFFGQQPPVEEECPDNVLEELRKRGNGAFSSHDFYAAMRYYDEAVAMDGRDEIIRGNRSAARLRAGEIFGALSDAIICMKLSPEYAKGRHRLGNAWAAMGYEDKAKEVYREATRDFPDQQKAFEDIAAQTAAHSGLNSPDLKSNLVVAECLKIAPRAAEIEVELQLNTPHLAARALRLGCLIYVWQQLTGQERYIVYEEFVRAQYAGPAPENPTAEFFARAQVPPFDQACAPTDVPPVLVKYISGLGKESPHERVAALVLLFEASSIEERQTIASLLIKILQGQESTGKD